MTSKFQDAKTWRESIGLTQAELANELGCHTRTITGMETGYLANANPVDDRTFARYRLMVRGWLSKIQDPF